MFHPYGMVIGVFPERLDGYKGPTGCGLMSQEFYETDLSRGFVRGYSFELLRGMGPVSTALWGMSAGRLPWGDGHHEAYADALRPHRGRAGDLRGPAGAAQPRDARSRARPTRNGIPAPRIEYRLSENSQRMLEHGVARGEARCSRRPAREWTLRRVAAARRRAGT